MPLASLDLCSGLIARLFDTRYIAMRNVTSHATEVTGFGEKMGLSNQQLRTSALYSNHWKIAKFIPALCGGPAPNDKLRDLLALPCRLPGGLGLVNPTNMAEFEYSASTEVTAPIVQSVLSQEGVYTYETLADQLSAIADVKKRKRSYLCSTASQLKLTLPPDLQRAMDLSQEKGASNWLTTLPVGNLVSAYTRVLLEMLLLYVMVGLFVIAQPLAPVGHISQLSMLCPV